MALDMKTHHVPFITVEDDDDLIVSFPLGEYAADSLTLLRTPKYEILLPEEEGGVSVDIGEIEESARQLLVSVEWGPRVVKVASNTKNYALNIESVSEAEISEAKRVLRKMNFDGCFELKNVQQIVEALR